MTIESRADLEGLTRAGHVVALALNEMRAALRPGLTTAEIEAVGGEVLNRHGARSAPQLFYGFPGLFCISVNDEAVHGIAGARVLRPGDLVKLDVTVELDGYVADAAITVALPPVSALKRRLCECTESALQQAIGAARAGRPISDIGRSVEQVVKRERFTVIPELTGHGVGRRIHEDFSVPNYYDRRHNRRLVDGQVLALEPIVSAGARAVSEDADGWTLRTTDGSPAAHFEHTIVVTNGRPRVLTAL